MALKHIFNSWIGVKWIARWGFGKQDKRCLLHPSSLVVALDSPNTCSLKPFSLIFETVSNKHTRTAANFQAEPKHDGSTWKQTAQNTSYIAKLAEDCRKKTGAVPNQLQNKVNEMTTIHYKEQNENFFSVIVVLVSTGSLLDCQLLS